MLKCVYRALKKDGELVYEFGGYGNAQIIHGALEKVYSKHGYIY